MITFRVGAFDAEVLEKEFSPVFTAEDLVNLGFTQIYLKLMIDGVSSKPFSAKSIAPIQKGEITYKAEVIKNSRDQYTKHRSEVEKEINDWHAVAPQKEPQKDFQKEPRKEVREDFQRRSSTEQQPRPERFEKSEVNKVDENKAAFLKIKEELESKEKLKNQQETFSLNSLKKEKEGKNPSKENISNLKEALSSVLPKKNEATQKQAENSNKHHHDNHVVHENKVQEKKDVKKEIPEEVLKKLLSVDE
jgi:hypothetical protein